MPKYHTIAAVWLLAVSVAFCATTKRRLRSPKDSANRSGTQMLKIPMPPEQKIVSKFVRPPPGTNYISRTNYLYWSNNWTFTINIVQYKTSMLAPWTLYCYVTNANTNQCILQLDKTNQQAFFRVGFVATY